MGRKTWEQVLWGLWKKTQHNPHSRELGEGIRMDYRVTGAVYPRWVADRAVVLGNGNRSQKRCNRLLWGVLILVLIEVVAAVIVFLSGE